MNLELLIPEMTLAAVAVAIILLDLFVERKSVLAVVGFLGTLVAIGFTVSMWGTARSILGDQLAVDNYALFFKVLFAGIAVLVILATTDYAAKFSRFQGEYYALILTSALGMMLMAAGTDLITIYIGLELTSISLYALIGFLKEPKSTEASLKYLLLGAVASAVLLYGMALVFGLTGQTNLAQIAAAVQSLSLDRLADQSGTASRHCADRRRIRLQDCRRPLPHVGPGCL